MIYFKILSFVYQDNETIALCMEDGCNSGEIKSSCYFDQDDCNNGSVSVSHSLGLLLTLLISVLALTK